MQDWGHGLDSAARGVPLLQCLANVLTCPFLCNAKCASSRQCRRHPCRGADADSHGPFFLSFSSCSTLIRWSSCVVQVPQCALSVGNSRDPTVAARFFLDQVVDMPVVCNDRCWVSECRKLRWSRSCSRSDKVVDVPVGAVHRQDLDVM